MDIKKFNKEELLKMRDEINSQIKYIDELRIDELKKEVSKSKEKLSDLDKNDKIFCINFYGSKIYNMDYVEINFYKQDRDGWINFSANHNIKPMGCSSSIKDECMNNHFFLRDSGSSFYFFTLKPKTWKEDLNSELTRLIKYKENMFNKDIVKFKNLINNLINCNDVDEFIIDFT